MTRHVYMIEADRTLSNAEKARECLQETGGDVTREGAVVLAMAAQAFATLALVDATNAVARSNYDGRV